VLVHMAVVAMWSTTGKDAEPASRAGEVMTVHFAGKLPNQKVHSSPTVSLFSGKMTSPEGHVLGTLTQEATCAVTMPSPCTVFEVTSTFEFTGSDSHRGRIVNQARLSAAPDPQHTGQLLVGIHPRESRITETSGVFAGRTGRAEMSGRRDCGACPRFAVFDDFWFIQLDEK
jgi:hypothetical protein